MSAMRALLAVAGVLVVLGSVGCSSPAPGTVEVDTHQQGAGPLFSDYASALDYAFRSMAQGKSPICMRVMSDGSQIAKKLARDCVKYAMITQIRSVAYGNMVTLHPSYVDDTLLLAVHRGDLPESSLSVAQRNALRKIQGVVQDIVRRHSGQYEQALAMHDYIVQTCAYDSEMKVWNQESVTVDLINTHRSVCDGYTRLYHLMLSLAGIDNKIVLGRGSDNVTHSWNLVCLDGTWTHVDCTYDDPVPDAPGRVLRNYFGMSDAMIARNHTWARADYPRASSSSMYYPTTRGLRFKTMEEFLRYGASYAAAGHKTITAYVQELDSSHVDAKSRLEKAQAHMRMNLVKILQNDSATPGIIHCHFR